MQHQNSLYRLVQHLVDRTGIEQPVDQPMMPLHQADDIRFTARNEIHDTLDGAIFLQILDRKSVV